jgi:hypothetical protein
MTTLSKHRDGIRAGLPGIVYHPIELLKPDPGNPRQHSKKQIGQIASIHQNLRVQCSGFD